MWVRMNKFIVLVALISISFTINGINKSIHGYIYDKETGEALIGALITNRENKGCITDNHGYFYLATSDTAIVEYNISFIGYKPKKVLMRPGEKPLYIYLTQQSNILQEVIVAGSKHKKDNLGKLSIPVSQIKQIPMIGGETDVLRAFQLLPGVQGGDEGTANLLVRGGSHDQNMFLMDNIPLYYVNHLGGFTSVFDINAINDVHIYKGGFPSQYGGRLSSIMNIGLKNGNKYETKRSVSVGLLSSDFFIEGPLKNEKTTYLFSARICNVGALIQAVNLINNDGYTNGYNFYDFTGKISHQIDTKNTLYVSMYTGLDNLSTRRKGDESSTITNESSAKERHRWGNMMTNVRWYHQYSPRLISNTSLAFSRFFNTSISNYENVLNSVETKSKSTYKSLINDFIIKTDLQYYLNGNQKVQFGADITAHTFSPFSSGQKRSSSIEKTDTLVSSKIKALNTDFYLGGEFSLLNRLYVHPGVRLSGWLSEDKSYFYPEPRILLSYKPIEKMSLSASYSHMVQYVHLLTNSSNTVPNDLWIPTTKKLAPEKSEQYSIELEFNFPYNYKFQVGAFYKSMNDLIEYEEALFSFRRVNWQDGITSGGKGKSKGFEFLLKKEGGVFDGWISYTLSKTTRQFDNINNGKEYPFKFDHRHDLNILCNIHLSKSLTFSTIWVYNGGNNITLPIEKYYVYKPEPFPYKNEFNPETGDRQTVIGDKEMEMFNYNGKNGYRTPAYHRLDIGLNYERKSSSWYLGIYNLYNRQNAYYFYLSNDQWKKYAMFPIIPSASYTYRF